jgi:hypothetical protein
VLVQHNFGDSYWTGRKDYYGITAMPTVCGDGMSDVWPLSGLAADLDAHLAVDSPLTISLSENGEGDFTAHIEAETAVTGARFCMVATHDDNVPGYGGSTSHLPYHVVHMMTATTGDAFELAAGASVDINHTFAVLPEWNYDKMGVACWVQAPGGTNTSPNPYGDVPIKNHVLQSAFLETGSTGVAAGEEPTSVRLMPPAPNPFSEEAALSFVTTRAGRASIVIYDVAGRRIAEILGERVSIGEHRAFWDGTGADGRPCPSGIYFARLVFDGQAGAGRKLVRFR